MRRYDVFWTPKSGTLWDSTHRRVGNLETWMRLDDSVGMDFFASPDKESARGVYYSLLGVGAVDGENIRRTVCTWLEKGEKEAANSDCCARFPSTAH
jgi:hypothetical protein